MFLFLGGTILSTPTAVPRKCISSNICTKQHLQHAFIYNPFQATTFWNNEIKTEYFIEKFKTDLMLYS